MGFTTVEKRIITLIVAYLLISWSYLVLEDRGFLSPALYLLLVILTTAVFLVMAVLLKKNGFFNQ